MLGLVLGLGLGLGLEVRVIGSVSKHWAVCIGLKLAIELGLVLLSLVSLSSLGLEVRVSVRGYD
jgi:hypothetical protein